MGGVWRAVIPDFNCIKAYPKHNEFLGEVLENNDLNHGGKAIPLSGTLYDCLQRGSRHCLIGIAK